MSEEIFMNGLTFSEYMNREAEFSDVSRALLMARQNNDMALTKNLLAQVDIDYDVADNVGKMIYWLIGLANSFASALAATTGQSVSELLLMDASAFYQVQGIILDKIEDNDN